MRGNPNQSCIVYMAVNKINGKRYIGVTKRSLDQRKKEHITSAKKGRMFSKKFYRAIQKYGEQNFEWSILNIYENVNEALDAECNFLEKERPEYNILIGRGHEPLPSFNGKKVMCLDDGKIFNRMKDACEYYGISSSSLTGACNGTYHTAMGKFFIYYKEEISDEKRIQILNEKKKKKVNSLSWENKPSEWVKNQKEIIRVRNSKRRKKILLPKKSKYRSDEEKKKWSINSKLGSKSRSKPVICLDDGKIYESANSAATAYNIQSSSLIELCNGKRGRKTVKGLKFAYIQKETA